MPTPEPLPDLLSWILYFRGEKKSHKQECARKVGVCFINIQDNLTAYSPCGDHHILAAHDHSKKSYLCTLKTLDHSLCGQP